MNKKYNNSNQYLYKEKLNYRGQFDDGDFVDQGEVIVLFVSDRHLGRERLLAGLCRRPVHAAHGHTECGTPEILHQITISFQGVLEEN